MARLYADENFSHAVVHELRQLAHDVVTVQETDQANRGTPDADVLAYAITESRAVVTFNRSDFKRLHRNVQPHCGIIICTRDDAAAALASRIDQAIMACPNLANQLIRVYRPNVP